MSANLTMEVVSSGYDSCRTILVKIGDEKLHQDGILIDKDDDRGRFVKAIVSAFQAKYPKAGELDTDALLARLIELDDTKSTPVSEPPEPYPVDLLPPVMARYVTEGAAARYVDPAMVALPLLVTMAGCIGTSRRVAIKPDWLEPPTLWGAVVARSGSVKSPGLDLAADLLADAESAAYRDHQAAEADHRTERLEYERDLTRWKKSKSDEDPPAEPIPPVARRLLVEDTTIEALCPILAETPRGVLVMADELRGWLEGMGAYASRGPGRDEARWLSLHGARPISVDRKMGRERILIELATASVTGTIQPEVLASTMHDGSGVASGLLARLLIVMPPARPKRWTDDTLSQPTQAAMLRVVDRLRDELQHCTVDDRPRPIDLPLSPEARQRARAYVDTHGAETYAQPDSLAAAWSKLEAYAFRLAMVVHLVRWASGEEGYSADGPIGAESIEAGIELARWHGAEAERAYAAMGFGTGEGGESKPDDRHADRLEGWLQARGGSATEREIARGPRRYRGDAGAAHIEADCSALVADNRAQWDVSRRTRRIVLSPGGDTGDGDTSTENTGKNEEVSPNASASVATPLATLAQSNGDTLGENTGKIDKVSPSPLSPLGKTGEIDAERVRVRI